MTCQLLESYTSEIAPDYAKNSKGYSSATYATGLTRNGDNS